ncbi:MAG: vitamin K epoxide reductase family protein [Planctomycetes bacterium]|nr:vitamin K epoxide reductase family protein [Planctomycetota bacterium]
MIEQAEVLRRSLREGRSASLARRRGVAALSALAMIDAGLVALQQMGALRLPDPPGPFDTDAVVGSREAFLFGAPDAALGALAHGLALVLAGVGGDRSVGRHPAWSLALAGVVGGAGLVTWGYLGVMFARFPRWCPYCISAGLLSLGATALAVPEALEAAGDLRRR